MSDTKHVIVEHRASDPVSTRAQKALRSERHLENWSVWLKVINGGVIECESYGMAINLRQSMYTTRKLSRQVEGATPFDHLTIRLEYDDTKLVVETKRTGILKIIPNAPAFTEDDADTAFNDKTYKAYVIPTPPLINESPATYETPTTYEGDGRPPIDLDEIFPTDPVPPKTTE